MLQNKNIQLKPIIEPDPVVFSFDAVGWKVLFSLLLLTIVFILYKYYLHYKINQYRREAIKNINDLSNDQNISIYDLISQVMFQIKQTALQTYDRKTVASLEGNDWLQYLDKKVIGSNFINDQEIIIDAVYKDKYIQTNHFNRDDFINKSIKWIKEHA